jgi:4'-phosphopantetheinyl transferase
MRHDIFTQGREGVLLLPRPKHLSLPKHTVQIWVLDDSLIETACTALANTLSHDEQQRARSYRQAKHRHRFVARRSVLRGLLGAYLSCRPESLRFDVTPFGKPLLKEPNDARLAFNVSHTEGTALLAFAWDCMIGVDIERRTGNLDIRDVGRGVFSSIEQKAIDTAQADPAATLFKIWTRKEALLKALGTGLSVEPDAYTTEDDFLRGEGHWRASHHGVAMSRWTCVDLVFGPQLRGALAVSLDDARVVLRDVLLR